MDQKTREAKVRQAKGLYQLALRGSKEESASAETKLTELMTKYQITMDEIDSEKEDFYYYKVRPQNKKLFNQVVYSIILEPKFYTKKWFRGVIIKTTPEMDKQIKEKYKFYVRLFKKEMDLFQKAFINRQELFHPDAPKREASEMTAAEWEELMKIIQIMSGIEKSPYLKQLGQEN